MTINGWIQIALYCALILVCVKPLGVYMARVFAGERTFLAPVLGPVERALYRLCGVNEKAEQHWLAYAAAMLLFGLASFLAVYALQRLQAVLPFNPAEMGAVSPDSAFNTAVSFASNTNWQGYGGETTMSYLTQMLALTVQNFVSAATGIALAIALVRGFARRQAATIGNFWVDLTRATLYVLLPLSIVVALALVALGVPQTLGAYVEATTLEGAKQVLAPGPVASQIAIKQLGTNGGGFYNANSAAPYENPNAISNLIEMWSILVISAALTYTFGRMVRDQRQGWTLLAAMGLIWLGALALLFDPQTAGGMIAGVAFDRAADCLAELRATGHAAASVVGRVVETGLKTERVKNALTNAPGD
jgi:K+-transporting ATPase ATPase A chain